MSWNRRYQVKSYIRSALWVVPLVALLLEQLLGNLAYKLDTRLAWKGLAFGLIGLTSESAGENFALKSRLKSGSDAKLEEKTP
jgi:hypothetical protein